MKKIFFTMIFSIMILPFISCKGKNSGYSRLLYEGEALMALSPDALNAYVDKKSAGGDMFFKFTQKQSEEIIRLFTEEQLNSVQVKLEKMDDISSPEQKGSFTVGLLYKDDFDEKGKLKAELSPRGLIKGNFSDYDKKSLSLVMASRKVPAGFFVHGDTGIKVAEFNMTESVLGFEVSDEQILFAFGYDGGELQTSFDSADFVAAGDLFPSFNSTEGVMPKIELSFKKLSDYGNESNPVIVKAKYGKENFSISMSPALEKLILQTSSFESKNSIFSLGENSSLITAILMKGNPKSMGSERVIEPFETDLGFVPSWPVKNWRTEKYELYQWNLFPRVLFFDFKDYATQSRFFTRMAYFVEKEGYKGTLQNDQFVATHRGYNAHDYKAIDMAAFFSKAVKDNFPLNEEEMLLRTILVHNKILVPEADGTFSASEGSVISISRETAAATRIQLMAHESWHGIFFSSQNFRDFVKEEYENRDKVTWNFMKIYFTTQNLGYDVNDEYLMMNEYMAYHMQRSVEASRQYWLDRASWANVAAAAPSQSVYVKNSKGQRIVDQSQRFSDYVFKNWGLRSGKAWLCERE